MRWLLQGRRWERGVLAVIAAIVAYQVFFEPIVGTSDNRDYWRVMKQIGVGYKDSPDPTFFSHIQRDFVIVPKEEVKYLTSQVLLGHIAVSVNDVVSKDGHFDICVMGLVNSLAYLSAIAIFLAAVRGRKQWIRVCVGASALLIFTDVRLVAYFNSFYCESAQLVFLVATAGLALLTADESRTRRFRFVSYFAFLMCSVLFLFAKTQDLVFSFPIAVIASRLLPFAAPCRYLRSAIAAAFVVLFIWGMKSDAYAVTHQVNVNVTLDEEIFPHSKDPTADLHELGEGDRANVTFGRIAVFYAHHPIRWWKVAKRRLHEAFTRTPYGNFERPLHGESQAFDGFSKWKNRHYPRSLTFWIIVIVGYLTSLAAKWHLGGQQDRALALVNAMWTAGCVLEFIAIVTFEANGTEKHFFIFNVLVDLLFVMSLLEIDRVVGLWRDRRRPQIEATASSAASVAASTIPEVATSASTSVRGDDSTRP